MKILVSNIGSTSFKFRLFQMDGGAEREIASGGADRIGGQGGILKMRVGATALPAVNRDFADHGAAIQFVLEQLSGGGALTSPAELGAVAFKAVMAGDWAPVSLVTDELLARMEYFIPVAPAHNPPYIAAMRMFRSVLKDTPLVAAFEPGFHRTMPPRRRYYAAPLEWAEKYGVKKYGYHGASHAYIAARTAELMGADLARRVISCHLGGSSSICAIRDGKSVATSFGLSPQSGLPQTNRGGEFDAFAFPLLKRQAGLDAEAVLAALGKSSGLAALSGTSGDMRDVLEAARGADGPEARTAEKTVKAEKAEKTPKAEKAQLAIDLFVTAVRDYVGAYLLEMGGADAIVFTGGIGEHNPWLRSAVCANMEFAGIRIDESKNQSAPGEGRIEAANSLAAIWVMPTNEELIVARQAEKLLNGSSEFRVQSSEFAERQF